MPISHLLNVPEGSDGRAPGPNPGPIGTSNQFQGLLTLGGTVTSRTGASNANGTPILVALRARIGQPLVGSSFAYLFGDVIRPPETDEYGVSLAVANPTGSRPPTSPATYWLPEPYSTNQHHGLGYYWSPHAETVYAAQPGVVTVIWRKAQPSAPIGSPPDVSTANINGFTYTLYTKRDVISVAAVKRPRRMYWTEGSFTQLGRPITIPTDRIKDIKIVYNDLFRQFTELKPIAVTNTLVTPTNTIAVVVTNLVRQEFPFDGTQSGAIAITNTLWYDRTLNSLRAYNVQDRRVFVEFLGDKRGQLGGQDIHHQLGYEIVEVIQRPSAADVSTDLGERLTPFQGAPPAGTPQLFADPVINIGQEFAFRHSVVGTPDFEYFAIRETQNVDDYQMHWMEEGLQGLRWPYRYVRYQMDWPKETASYSHYIRPVVATEDEAKATAVALPAQNAPQIAYQDPLDQPRGKLTENFAYYTFLDPTHPAHRALLKFSAGEYVRFERVFSWLDESLRDRDLVLPIGGLGPNDPALDRSVATNLNWVGNTGIAVRTIRANVGVCSLATADAVLANSAQQSSALTETFPVVNFVNTGAGGNFPGDASFSGLNIGSDSDNFVVEATGVLLVPRTGYWTFGVNSDDGFRCDIGTNSFAFAAPRGPGDTLATFYLTAGQYPLRLVFYECSGGAELELFAAQGSHTNFNSAFSLVGDQDAGGLTVIAAPGFVVRNIRANVGVCNLAAADTVLADPAQQAEVFTAGAPVINFVNTGGGGNFGSDVTFPGMTIGVDIENFVLEATGVILIPASGYWTFGVNSDDGFRFEIGTNSFSYADPRPPGDTLATCFLAAGSYPARLVFYECQIGAEVELFAAPGVHVAFNSSFRLVGDASSGGLTVTRTPDFSDRPRVVNTMAPVGRRLTAPVGELGSGLDTNYLAGYIRVSEGDSYHPAAYVDPFTAGFDLANRGAIIPVNAIPGKNLIEVWWFRQNAVDRTRGFRPTYWPAVIGRYTTVWPADASEIILASNDGSGALPSLEAKGKIYVQNDATLPGYNPNEEHALMQGGQAWALRDDLNITSPGPSYSSDPFVLLEYTESDGKLAVRPFHVLREKPSAGITFDYQKQAAQILQPPMPIPLLGVAFAPKLPGTPRKGLNEEFVESRVSGAQSDPANPHLWTLTTDGRHGFSPLWPLALQDVSQNPPVTRWFFGTNTTENAIEGIVSTNLPLALTALPRRDPSSAPGNALYLYPLPATTPPGSIPKGKAVIAVPALSRSAMVDVVPCPSCGANELGVRFLNFPGDELIFWTTTTEARLVPATSGLPNGFFNGWRVAWNGFLQGGSDAERQELYNAATVTDRKGNVWVYRGPHRADRPEAFSMRFYYNTLPGFFFPSLAPDAQPPVGTPTPYLRKRNRNGQFIGDPVYGNQDLNQESDQNALPIVYHPYWPDDAPVLQMAETLTTPKRGLPAVRGQTSLQVLYQQSQIEADGDNLTIAPEKTSVVLHDPTREKTIEFNQANLPGSVRTESSRGKIYFPNLPPHLVKRFWLDPNRGANGLLVFLGEFADAPLGDKYLLLNVAGTQDATTLRELCRTDLQDPKKSDWDAAIDALATDLEKFVENPAVPGTFIVSPSATRTVGLGAVAEVVDDDVAVDSYALTAIGPDTGYITLIAGNGLAFTPEGEPVSMEVIRVVPELYRGEVVVIESENPLNERLTLQQVVDLAGHAEDYTFDWRITAPVDGQPPETYTRTLWPGVPLTWSHVRFPLDTDRATSIEGIAPSRVVRDISDVVAPVSDLRFEAVQKEGDLFRFILAPASIPHRLTRGNRLVMSSAEGTQVLVTVNDLPASGSEIVVSVDPNQAASLAENQIFRLAELVLAGQPQSIAFSSFVVNPTQDNLTEVWVSLTLAEGMGANLYLNGGLVVKTGFAAAADNTLPDNPSSLLAAPRLTRSFRLPSSALAGAIEGPNGLQTNRLAVELFAPALPGALLDFQVRVEAIKSTDQVVAGTVWIPLDANKYEDGVRAIVGGTADVRSLSDNYLTMRYRPNGNPAGWSQWTEPQLAEGWIKRVLKGINPFNQRITDLYNNAVNTDVSVISQAGARWEGNVALNLDSINNYGLIEIYESVLNRGRDLSIDADINYGPANDALLLAASYINDLYMLVGNEAAADAANPTIGIGTKDSTYGDIATALFSFKGQLPSLLAEELALLRGRDDFLVPGVETRPVYNRLVWNYTRGIDAGEVIYALNYNILDQNTDGKRDALDALKLFPQGHGDAYGHYLTALKGYYHLFLNPNFDWVPRSEAVLVLGKPVSVDYQDERKFAAAAGALARTGRQIFDLTWRQDYQSGRGQGWEHFRSTRESNKGRTRAWGLDHWASRTGQGAYVNWIAGNAILPYQDPDPAHADTIQQVDRTTVPELKELPSVIEALQTAMDNAESGLTPLGLPEDAVPFDLNPNAVAGGEGNTHFEQIYSRAKGALNNALVAFDDAKDVTRLMRSEQDSLADLRAAVDKQELAYTNTLIELFGTPYPEDIGPGRTYRAGFAGPDSIHFMYVDNVELDFRNQFGGSMLVPSEDYAWSIDTQTFTADWLDANGISDFSFIQPARNGPVDGTNPLEAWVTNTTLHVDYNLSSHGFFKKPAHWVGRRASPGRIQQAISDIIKARNAAFTAFYWTDAAKYDLDWAIQTYDRKRQSREQIRGIQATLLKADTAVASARLAWEIAEEVTGGAIQDIKEIEDVTTEAIPKSFIAGLAAGGDIFSGLRAALGITSGLSTKILAGIRLGAFITQKSFEFGTATARMQTEFNSIAPEEWNQELRNSMDAIRDKVYGMNNRFMDINARLQELDDAHRRYRALLAEADRIQAEREIFRQRTAAVIQGYRTRDAAFRIFRNEKLERYKSLFDLAAQYAFMAAKAYDYETGLLGTERGREFIDRIVNSRALGVVRNGQPQFAGSNNGDPGLSSVLAEMNGDWSVVKSRLGFNNPDAYGTTVSLSYENHRIITNDVRWQDVLSQARKANLLEDPDVRRFCLQIDDGTGMPVPGFVFEFGTTIGNGLNLFGRPLAPGDHKFTASAFATKIFAAGVALEGYVGMDDPAANSGAVAGAGGNSPPDPSLVFLDPNALSANPYIYLIPVGVDSMRSPPLGDTSEIRSWNVNDVAIPLPFNIGGSDYSSKRLWQSEDSLTEAPFTARKHQAFRPVSSGSIFSPSIYTTTGGLQRSQFTNNRLIGRSVWNSKWKIVIPGRELLADPNEGMERFLRTVKDVKLHFVTYSYSGN